MLSEAKKETKGQHTEGKGEETNYPVSHLGLVLYKSELACVGLRPQGLFPVHFGTTMGVALLSSCFSSYVGQTLRV